MITLYGRIDEQHRLILELPDDFPTGEVQVIIQPVVQELTHEEIQRRLRAVGLLVEPDEIELPEDFIPFDEDELDRIGKLLAQGRPLDQLIDEDRGDY